MGLDGDVGRVSRAGPRTEDGDMGRGVSKDRDRGREMVGALPSCPGPAK